MISSRSLVVLVVLLAGCGTPPPAAPKPAASTAPAPEPPTEWGTEDAPLVVDWTADKRAALETLLKKGKLIAVAAKAGGLELVADCELPGAYAYEAIKTKEDLVRRGASEIGIVQVGRYATKTRALYTHNLPPSCREATHFVKAIGAGAFAVRNAAVIVARDATDVFDDAQATRAGDIDLCKAKVDPRSPPAGCRSPILIEIVTLDPRSEVQARCEDGEDAACSQWSAEVFDVEQGKAVDPAAAQVILGKAVGMCKAGKVIGCVLASAGAKKEGAPKIDLRDVSERGCKLKNWSSCIDLAHALAAEGNAQGATDALQSACAEGDSGCGELGDAIEKSAPKSKEQWQTLADVRAHACLFAAPECDKYAALRRGGFVARGEFPTASRRVDDCKMWGDCYIASAAEALGIGVPRDVTKAKKSFERFCKSPEAQITYAGKKCELPPKWQ